MINQAIQEGKESPARVGIMTCSNITQNLNCASSLCLKALRNREGQFALQNSVELAGIISCAGCPGIFGADKLANRIRALTELDVDTIHFSSCVVAFCPFKEQYRKMINEKYPDIEVVFGTHDTPEGGNPEMFIQAVRALISQPKADLVDLMKPFV